jgi:hypothetical protein
MTSMTIKALAVAALALAGSTMIGTSEAEARRFGGGGFHGGGFRGGFHGGGFRHGGPRFGIRPLWARPGGWHGHRHWGWRRHVSIGVIGIGAVAPACTVIRRFDPVYGIYRRVTVCD